MGRTRAYLGLLAAILSVASASVSVEHSLDGGATWQGAGKVVGDVLSDMVVNWERPALSDTELAQLEKAAQSNGLYVVRVKGGGKSESELLTSVPAACLLGEKLFEKAELAADRSGQLLSFNYAISDCAKRVAGGAVSPPSATSSSSSSSEEGVGTRPASLPVRVVLPRPGPALLVPEFVGEFADVNIDAELSASGSLDPNAKPRAPVQAQGARKGAPPPKDERTWLQKNWMFVLAGGLMVFNMVMKANAPEGQQAGGPPRPGGGAPAAAGGAQRR
ncbi:hypothetical protein HYH02_007454 [Chlamydomonas schloesseri]|uniref:ER membrane protein complex subunit 10 n=1 Tax=Chlamydomonas schloesseri TaxID=2026947 RepID=A0A836B4P4_9CHLO|nr:hypothetical protein HYH02_007454 [Chlamydomonas schloesseri]|eukprot:KAG2447530.1 hypothetical protein HYH02_007454 [Chlamydomonas schloesseri]